MLARYCKNILQVWCCLLLMLPAATWAQDKSAANTAMQIKGRVLDNFGHPLAGARVSVRQTGSYTITGPEGLYEINAVPGNVLVVTHPSFLVIEQKINAAAQTNIRLVPRPLPLQGAAANGISDTLVYVGKTPGSKMRVLYGEKDVKTALGATATIYNDQLTTTPASLYAYALPGRLAGLYTKQWNGWAATSGASITQGELLFDIPNQSLVGATGTSDNNEMGLSLRGQSPITVIDGIQRDIYAIDPETIESISVQKDALSSILLGQRSSRGVLLVTTKKPLQGAPHISLTAQTGVQTPLGLLDPLPAYQYAYLLNEALVNSGQSPIYTKEQFEGYRANKDPYLYPNVSWKDELIDKHSMLSRYSLNISGGSSVARYLVNLNYTDQQGMFKEGGNNSYSTQLQLKRYLINTKVDVDLNKNLNIALQIFGRIQDGNQPGAGYLNIYQNMLLLPNNAYPALNPNKTFGGSTTYQTNLYAQLANSGYILNNDKELLSTVDLTYKLDNWVPGLYFKGKANVSVLTSSVVNRSKLSPVYKMNVSGADTSYVRYGNISDQDNKFSITSSGQSWFYQASLGYNKQIGRHNIEAVTLLDQLQTTYNFDLPSKYTNVAGKVAYNFDQKYLVEGALTYSGYDRFKPGNRFFLFYAASLGWNIAEENFVKNNLPWLNTFKLRANYGQTGNANVGYFTWRPAYQDQFLSYGWGVNNVGINGVYERPLVNVNAEPEKAHKLNFGLDVAVLRNRLQVTAEYYRDEYYDLMQGRGRSVALMGNGYPAENIGRNKFTGTELTVTWQDNVRDFNYYITANANFADSRILFSDEIGRRYDWNVRTGQKVGATFGYIADGLIQTQEEAASSATVPGYTLQPGDIKYRDLNQDGIIDQFDETNIDGNKPLFFYGISGGFQYKGFNFSVLLQGVQNRIMYLNSWETEFEFGAMNRNGTLYNHHLGRWTPENAATATYPRLTYGLNPNNHLGGSTFWQHSGDYLRLKNIELGYSLPYSWTKRLKLGGVRVFVNAQNLLTWAEFERGDPEVNGKEYPMQKVINTGINIKL
ncbi:SusC/RagA family TonB-linked outer membrane protein [Paraflavitalea sp. CAU 1676]|uniref:SusC/RagA family TonB-linked outer membrane protein n=1 Tax=Paraflavitalea sp. CAU 1676 TaxID=3032598 RepID=UPI0023DA8CF8|nr:SusC/RagA family TonB-linked outer membrane protein [Paraflavitalea sp. CAU 1676]MDF2192318.1 SusC/RagA family TonB-linked outer membrane protein [Paraflavitalea sp. CAU 1676]